MWRRQRSLTVQWFLVRSTLEGDRFEEGAIRFEKLPVRETHDEQPLRFQPQLSLGVVFFPAIMSHAIASAQLLPNHAGREITDPLALDAVGEPDPDRF